MRVNDAISGLVLIALAATMAYLSLSLPAFPGQRFGPALFPQILAAGLTLCGALLVVRGLAARRAGASWTMPQPWMRDGRPVANVLIVVGAILAYILLSDRLGFVITAFGLLLILFLWFRVRPVTAFVTAVVATLAVDWFFGWLFRVPLPLGVLPNGPSYMLMNALRGL